MKGTKLFLMTYLCAGALYAMDTQDADKENKFDSSQVPQSTRQYIRSSSVFCPKDLKPTKVNPALTESPVTTEKMSGLARIFRVKRDFIEEVYKTLKDKNFNRSDTLMWIREQNLKIGSREHLMRISVVERLLKEHIAAKFSGVMDESALSKIALTLDETKSMNGGETGSMKDLKFHHEALFDGTFDFRRAIDIAMRRQGGGIDMQDYIAKARKSQMYLELLLSEYARS